MMSSERDERIDTSDIPELGEAFFQAAEVRLPRGELGKRRSEPRPTDCQSKARDWASQEHTMSEDSDIVMPEEFREIPLSGTHEEHDFGYRDVRCWFKFTDSRHMEWCGKFEPGCKAGSRKVLRFPHTREFFVLVDGQGCVVDSEQREVRARTKSDMLEDAIMIPGQGLVAVTDGLTIGLVGRTGDIWESKRLTFGGIAFDDASAHQITGKLWDLTDDWCDFVLHVDERLVESAWSYEEAFRTGAVSQIGLARVVVMTFGAAVTILGVALCVSYPKPVCVGLAVLGLSCLVIGRFASRKG